MSKEREVLEKSYEVAFGKKPRKNMKDETIQAKLDESPSKTESPENPDITEKMAELVSVAKSHSDDGESPVLISLVLGKKGIHMSMSGEGQDIAVMIATAIISEPRVGAVLSNGAMMAQIRMNNVAEEEAPEGATTPKTQA